jgi:molybdopterin-binding protein
MKLSARNQIPAKVTSITHGEALKELGLSEGSDVTAVVKASDVILATGD